MQDITYNGRKEDYQELITKGYEFKLGDYVSGGWNIAKQNVGGFMGFSLIIPTIVMVFYGIVGGIFYSVFAGNASPSTASIVVAVILGLIAYISLLVGMSILSYGYFIVADKIHRQEAYSFSDFFGAFAHWKQLLYYQLLNTGILFLTMGPALVIMTIYFYIPLLRGEMRSPEDIQEMSNNISITYLFMIPAYYFMIAFSFAPLFIIFGRLTYWDAMNTSRKVITKNFLWYLAFYFVMGMIIYVGIFAFLIGMLLSIPAALCMMYVAYDSIAGKKMSTIDNKIEEIGMIDQTAGYDWQN